MKATNKKSPAGTTQGTKMGQDTGTQYLGKGQQTGSGNEATGSPLNKGSQYGTEGNAVKSGTGVKKGDTPQKGK